MPYILVQTYVAPGRVEPQVKASQCFTKYKWRDLDAAKRQSGPQIVATQVSSKSANQSALCHLTCSKHMPSFVHVARTGLLSTALLQPVQSAQFFMVGCVGHQQLRALAH